MEKEIIWSTTAKSSFAKVITYLLANWSEKEVTNFVAKTEKTLGLISLDHLTFRSSGKKHVREVLVTKHNLLIYRIRKRRIEVLRFYDTRQNPKRKPV